MTRRHPCSPLFRAALGVACLVLTADSALAGPNEAPQFYSGYIEDEGVPAEGTAAVTLQIWDDAVSTDIPNLVCTTTDSAALVVAGRFSLPLDPTCADMATREELFLEVEVDGAVLPRVRVGKLPYAAAAHVANEAGGNLDERLNAAESAAFEAQSQASGALQVDALGDELQATGFDLNVGTTIGGAGVQAAIQPCPQPGDVIVEVALDGTPTCVPQAPDVVNLPQTLAGGTQIDVGGSSVPLQASLATACPVGQALSSFTPDGTPSCVVVPADVVGSPQILADGTQIDVGVTTVAVQGALSAGCPAGQAMVNFSPDGIPSCTLIPPDVVGSPQILATGTQIDLGGGTALPLQAALVSACPPGEALTDIGADGNPTCLPLPADVVDSPQILAAGTQVDIAGTPTPLQGALVSACPPGQVLSDFSIDGSRVCEALPPDVVASPQILASGTQVDTGGGPVAVQAALDSGCPPGQALSDIGPEGITSCVPLPADVVASAQILATGTQLDVGGSPLPLQTTLASACPGGTALSDFAQDGTRTCVLLPADASVDAVDLNAATTIGTASIQRALTADCPTGDFLVGFSGDGTPTCESPTGADIVTVGADHAHFSSVQAALTAIGLPTSPVVIEVQPGTYAGFVGVPNVAVVGSGVGVTIFEDTTSPVVSLDAGSLSHATVRFTDAAPVNAIEVATAATIEHVAVDLNPLLTTPGACTGVLITNGSASLDLEDVTISVFGNACSEANGVEAFSGVGESSMNFQRTEIITEDHGVLLNGGTLTCIECDFSADASATPVIQLGGGELHLMRSRIVASGATGQAIGIEMANTLDIVTVENSKIEANGTSGVGISSVAGTVRITHSYLSGTQQGFEFDAGASGTLLWTETNNGLGDIPNVCLYNTDDAGGNPCG